MKPNLKYQMGGGHKTKVKLNGTGTDGYFEFWYKTLILLALILSKMQDLFVCFLLLAQCLSPTLNNL